MDGQPSLHEPTVTHRRTIGPYVPVRRLGEGGMGIVYLAHDASGRKVAVKVMRPELASDEEFRGRFRKEAEAAKRVAPFCTAPVLDVGQDGEQHYLVTEYVEGPDLSSVVDAQGPLTGSNLEALAVGVATALGAIHRVGVIHRDLKPSNIVLAPVGPRVIDFGIAQLADTVAEHVGLVIGTPSYMSPEQARGEPVTAAADVFAWGCVIAYAGTGRPPFGRGPASEVLYRVAHHVPRLDELDERLRPLVEQALDKDPARRPTAQQLLDRLVGREEVAVEAATRIVSEIWTTPAAAEFAGTGSAGTGSGGTRSAMKRGWRRFGPPVAAAGVAVAVTAAVLIVVLDRERTTAATGPVAVRDGQVDGDPIRVTIDGVQRRGTSVSVRWTIKLTGTGGNWYPRDLFGNDVSGASLLDPPSGSKFSPARKNDACLCSAVPNQWYRPGDILSLYASYTGVPDGIETVSVDIPGLGLFPDLPVSTA
ncbi:serine/threonine-protein kinase [Sphaerisporangium perillae]|uniref:serine/threonine-protein kinase n=1 Tax=Sphaerisporangium perillae TaxID=2935860 RepID=UPI0020109E0D|nr:serine/threonine-protein kinase [Sphaerisporangium perillae]